MADIVHMDYPVPVLVTRQTGVLPLKERWAEAREVLRRAEALGCFRLLVDYRQAHVFEDAPAEAKEFVDFVVSHLAGHHARIAGVVRFDHQVDPTVEQMVAARGIVFRRFDDFADALDWLQSERPAEDPVRDVRTDDVHADRAPVVDPMSIAARAAQDAPSLAPAQYAMVVHLVADLLAEGMEEARIEPLARRMALSLARDAAPGQPAGPR